MVSEATAEPPPESMRNRIASTSGSSAAAASAPRHGIAAHDPAAGRPVIAVAALDRTDAADQRDHRRVVRHLERAAVIGQPDQLAAGPGLALGLLDDLVPVAQPVDQTRLLRLEREVGPVVDQPLDQRRVERAPGLDPLPDLLVERARRATAAPARGPGVSSSSMNRSAAVL